MYKMQCTDRPSTQFNGSIASLDGYDFTYMHTEKAGSFNHTYSRMHFDSWSTHIGMQMICILRPLGWSSQKYLHLSFDFKSHSQPITLLT